MGFEVVEQAVSPPIAWLYAVTLTHTEVVSEAWFDEPMMVDDIALNLSRVPQAFVIPARGAGPYVLVIPVQGCHTGRGGADSIVIPVRGCHTFEADRRGQR